jgi:SAM-dependent methyltransferase
MSEYGFDQAGAREKQRLDAQSALCDAHTFRYLDARGIGPGWRCIEVGAGNGTVARWMAQKVGATGHVVATELDTRFLSSLAADGIEVRREDVVERPPEPATYDLVHARNVLEHVPARARVFESLVRALRPGGWLVLEDPITPVAHCHPPLAVWPKVCDAVRAALVNAGKDPGFGLRMPGMLVEAGLSERGTDAYVPLMRSATPSLDVIRLTVEMSAEKLVASGAVTQADIDATLTAFTTPGYLLSAVMIVVVWGRAP